MKIIRKYLLVEKKITIIDDEQFINFSLGEGSGPWRHHPEYLFDKKEEAIQEAYNRSKYGSYVILEHITCES
jgi:hypothetical protein